MLLFEVVFGLGFWLIVALGFWSLCAMGRIADEDARLDALEMDGEPFDVEWTVELPRVRLRVPDGFGELIANAEAN